MAEEGRAHAAKRPGEALGADEPGVSEWGNPPGVMAGHHAGAWGAPGELKHLTYPEEQRGFPQ